MKWFTENKITIISLTAIILIAGILRLYRLGEIPALNADEAALGYNAYSLLKTGLDEHGNSWPLYFQSFNDYKPGLTVYLIMPMVSLFGLNEWSVRLIPAIFAILTIPLVFFIAKTLVINSKSNNSLKRYFPLVAALSLAVSPWHIHFSRGAWEVNIATFFLCLGSLIFLRIKENPRLLAFSAIFFVLSLYTYHAARIVAPVLVLVLAITNYKLLLENKKNSIYAVCIGLVCSMPLILSLSGPGGLARAGGVAIWADNGPLNRVNELRGNYQNMNGIIPKLLHNKPIAYSLAIMQNWSKHYWGEFLFLSGDDIQRNKVPETGQMHLIEFVFIMFGLYEIIRNNNNRKWIFIFSWLAVASIPAAITFQAPHALRAESMVIPLVLISSYGLVHISHELYTWKYTKRFSIFIVSILAFLSLLSVARYLHLYYGHMTKEYPFSSQYGLKELVSYLGPIHVDYPNVIVTDRYDQPYILFLFYLNYDPGLFQKDHQLTSRDQFGFSTVRSFSNFKFESISYNEASSRYPNSLLIGTDKEIPVEANVVKEIYGSNGYRYFRVIEN